MPYRLKPRFKIIAAWYDLWIGIFVDRESQYLYFFPIPMIGIRWYYGPGKWEHFVNKEQIR